MDQIGRVISVDHEMALLEVKRVGGCGSSCPSCKLACGEKAEYLSLPNVVHAKEGDFVEVEADSGSVLKYFFTIYGIPLILLVIFMTASYMYFQTRISSPEVVALLFGVGSFLLSYFIIKFIDKRAKTSDVLVIKRILTS